MPHRYLSGRERTRARTPPGRCDGAERDEGEHDDAECHDGECHDGVAAGQAVRTA
ncbi:hypothetical protein [Streptomyces fagopyri]